LLFFVVFAFGLFALRYKKMPKPKTEETMDSREFWLFIASMVFLLSALQIIISTSMPVFNKLFGPEGLIQLYDANKTISKPIDHFNSFQVPFAIVITALVAIGQYLSYRKTNMEAFYKNMAISAGISILASAAFAMYTGMTNPIYILLLFTSLFAILANADYWLRVAKGNIGIAGSSIAHIGFGFVILGALISNANKNIISQNQTFIHKEFAQNENLVLDQNDTVNMGDYFVTFTGERQGEGSESHYNYYDLEFYTENADSQLVYAFTLNPSIQKNERMGNVPEPDTRHFVAQDIYTHVTYADLRTPEEKSSDWQDELEFALNQSESKEIYKNITVTLDSVIADAKKSEDGSFAFIVLAARLSITGLADTVVHATPIYAVQNNQASTMDAELLEFGLKLQLAGIDTESNKPLLKAWRQKPEEKPFILIQAIVFPMINLLWLGCILMALGTGIAIWQRVKPRKA